MSNDTNQHIKNLNEGEWHMVNRRASDNQLSDLELKIVEGFTKLEGQNKSITEKIEAANKTQQKLLESIYGNGKVGLITQVATIETRQTSIKWIVTVLATTILGMAAFVIRSVAT